MSKRGKEKDKAGMKLHLLARSPEALFRSIAEAANAALVVMGEDERIIALNPATERIFGWKIQELLGQSIHLLMPQRYHQIHRESVSRCVGTGLSSLFGKPRQYEGIRRDGTEFPVEISISGFRNRSHWTFFAFMRDITERKQMQETLERHTVYDALTGLYNRWHFERCIQEQIAWAKRKKYSMAIALCDIDHFKEINDTKGHHAGDRILKAVAQGMQKAIRETDLIFRWGGDEIVLILPEVTRQGAQIAAHRIRKFVRTVGKEAGIDLDVSIGLALHPQHGGDLCELMHVADRALYIAKKGGDKVHIGEEDYCLDESAVRVVFQPIVDLRTNKIVGYEALSRDLKGRISILDLFKRYEAIGRLEELKRLCFKLQLKHAEKAGLKRLFLNVNFAMLAHFGFLPKPAGMEVVLEISELEALHDIQKYLDTARPWQEGGYKFAIDDFGAGFISLPFIARFIPNYIKVDRSALEMAVSSQGFREFTRKLFSALQGYVADGIIVEGIHTEEELRVVTELGIHLGQGFLLGRPQELTTVSGTVHPL